MLTVYIERNVIDIVFVHVECVQRQHLFEMEIKRLAIHKIKFSA